MKALRLNGIGKLEVEDIEKPTIKDDEVLVKVKACGICGSDIPRSFKDGAHVMPLTLGHEFSGQVEAVGDACDKGWLDRRVGIFPLIPCKKCGPCQKKRYEMCQNYSYLGSRRDGGFAEYAAVPEWNLINLPDNVSYTQAAMVEPMAVAMHAMRRVEPKMHDTVLVMGLGTIGLLLTMFLQEAGIKNILVVGNKDFQQENAMKLGIPAANYCDSRIWDIKDWVLKTTEQKGVDVFFECIGKEMSYQLAIELTAAAGRVCLVGNPYSDMSLDKKTYWQILKHQLTVTGTWNSSFTWDADDDWHLVIELLTRGRIHPEELVTHKYSLDEIIKGFEIMRDKSDDYIKIMAKF